MNSNIEQLYRIAAKPERRIIGLMSGTSLDGLDVALCLLRGSGGDTEVTIEQFRTVPYSDDVKHEIRRVFAKEQVDFQLLCVLNAWIGKLHGDMVRECLQMWNISPEEVDIVASHGQTVMHAPKSLHKKYDFPPEGFGNATLQIGDGDHVAVQSGVITLSDFRQKHVAKGGEGAPLAVYGDYFLFSKRGENRIMLNMGGIANFTYLPASLNASEVFTTDTGTGNTLLDAYVRKSFGKMFDTDGKIALAGVANPRLLAALKDHPFFDAPFPKTTGPELFNIEYIENVAKEHKVFLSAMPAEDVMATLARFSAETIADAVRRVMKPNERYALYMSGGGAHNPSLVNSIKELLPDCTLGLTDDLGILGDAKEAVLFATLANEALTGGETSFGEREGVPTVSMGKISFPK
ncbi:MAG: anhydro-N-acetylmuramic acid kinase [Candidatus Kapaibacterium sp.]|nr:MAG: anhydro-N-acetylmuramic acid kinase [Candidatus Kapabacteria bacterium]